MNGKPAFTRGVYMHLGGAGIAKIATGVSKYGSSRENGETLRAVPTAHVMTKVSPRTSREAREKKRKICIQIRED